jgi:hypothetical protein
VQVFEKLNEEDNVMTELADLEIETVEELAEFTEELSDEALDRTKAPHLCTSFASRQ